MDNLVGYGSANTETLGDLVWSFFEFWAWRHDFNNTVISIRTLSPVSKAEKEWTKRVGNERHLVSIEVCLRSLLNGLWCLQIMDSNMLAVDVCGKVQRGKWNDPPTGSEPCRSVIHAAHDVTCSRSKLDMKLVLRLAAIYAGVQQSASFRCTSN